MKTRELILEENNDDRLDAFYVLLKAIEWDLKKHTIKEILLDSLELNQIKEI